MPPGLLQPKSHLRFAGAVLTLYCLVVVVLGLPAEMTPNTLFAATSSVVGVLDDHGLNAWHRVFPGQRNHEKRRHIAIRFVGTTVDGQSVVLHEAPEGLVHPEVRVFDNLRTTVSYKMLRLAPLSRIMRTEDDAQWRTQLDQLRRQGHMARYVYAFCSSDHLAGEHDLLTVDMELFTAGIDYHTGAQYGRAAGVLRALCYAEQVVPHYGIPQTRPGWPGVEWREVS